LKEFILLYIILSAACSELLLRVFCSESIIKTRIEDSEDDPKDFWNNPAED